MKKLGPASLDPQCEGEYKGAQTALCRPPRHPETLQLAPCAPASLSPGARGKQGSQSPSSQLTPGRLPSRLQQQEGNLSFFPQRCSNRHVLLAEPASWLRQWFPVPCVPSSPGPGSHSRPQPGVRQHLGTHTHAHSPSRSLGSLHCLWGCSRGRGRLPFDYCYIVNWKYSV